MSILFFRVVSILTCYLASTPRDSTDGTETEAAESVASATDQMQEMNIAAGLVTSQEIDEVVNENSKCHL